MLGKKGEIGAGGIQVITSQGFGAIELSFLYSKAPFLLNLVSLGELFDKLESTTKESPLSHHPFACFVATCFFSE